MPGMSVEWSTSTRTQNPSRFIWNAQNCTYFAANEVKCKKQVAVFFNLIGRETYSLLRNLISPAKPVKSPEELMDILQEHFEPKKVVVASRYQFPKRQQQSGESVPTYFAELRKRAVPCEFGAALNKSLRDRLVCGLRSDAHQKRLLSESKLTLDKALVMHPIPKPEDIFASLAGGQHFSTLDLSQAYQQLLHDDTSKELVTINTHPSVKP